MYQDYDLKHEVDVKEQLFKLLHAVEENQFLQLSSEYSSRKLLLLVVLVKSYLSIFFRRVPEISTIFIVKIGFI